MAEEGKSISDRDQKLIASALAGGVGSKSISDADQKFIARMNRMAKEGPKAISDHDQRRYELLTGKPWPTGGGRTTSDRDLPGGRTISDRDLPGGRTTSDRLRKHGGSVKKYAKGGGIRKARYK